MDVEVSGLARGSSDLEGLFVWGRDDELNEPRFGRGCNPGELRFPVRGNVLDDVEDGSVGDVGRNVHVAGFGLFNALLFITDGYGSFDGVDQDIRGFGEAGAFLNVMVRDETEDLSFSEDGCLIIQGTVFEAKSYTGRNAVTVNGLSEVAGRNYAAVGGAHGKKALRGAFREFHGDWITKTRPG